MKRQALGRGLSSLIPEAPQEKPEAGLLMLDIDRIQPSRYQPRTDFGGLEGLVASIRQNGLVQPVVVKQEGDRYHLVAGERRWRAAQLAGVNRIPAIVRTVSDDRLLELALVENIQRKDLTPLEEAKAYDVLLNQMKLSQTDLAERVGRDRSSISNSLRILRLPEKVQGLIQEGLVSSGHAKAIMAIPDAVTQIKVAEEVASKMLSVRETERLVSRCLRRGAAPASARTPGQSAEMAGDADPNVRFAENRLCRALATKVRIRMKGESGWIEIGFFSQEELERLYRFLLTAEKGH